MFKKIALITTALIACTAAWAYVTLIFSEVGLMQLYPELDQHVVIKANRIMVGRTITGEYNHLDTDDEEVLKEIFMKIVNEFPN